MLERLELRNVGPAPSMQIGYSRRINVITGDNGLGKSFLLDVGWWALTRTWARRIVVPHGPPAKPTITYRYTKKTRGSYEDTSRFDRSKDMWSVKPGRPPIPGLVLYAQVDGGFSVWDPARNYWKGEDPDRPAAYLFAPEEVWHGNVLCEGLVRDWASWQREGGAAYGSLKSVLSTLSPSGQERLEPGDLKKISLDDPKRYPTLRMPYGQDVAVVHASAGMRRIIALAYLLVWTWHEHLASAELRGDAPAKEIIFLIDEIEAHLHPQWQRRIVPALLDVMKALTGAHDIPVQLITATHSPLVLASMETRFDEQSDTVWELDLQNGEVELNRFPWSRRGDANAWLTSSAFDLKEPRSIEAEEAITRALALLREEQAGPERMESVEKDLRSALSDIDPFWVRWSQFRRRQGGG